jgi:hypothetical protein
MAWNRGVIGAGDDSVDRSCTGDFPTRKSKKTSWVPHTQKNRNKKNEQAKPTEQLQTTPKSLIFDFNNGDQTHAGVHIMQCYHRVLPALAM